MTDVDPIVLDLIENALKNARFEMDEVVRRAAMSPTIREQHDEFPMIANERGEMIVGQFGSYIPEVIRAFGGEFAEGDVILQNDPYICKGSISHTNDWLVMLPIHHRGELVGFASLFGHMMDVGGPVPGSQISDARSIWEEGLRIPPIKIMEARARQRCGARDHPQQHAHAGHEPVRSLRHRRGVPAGGRAGGGDLRALRRRDLPGRLRGAARAHPQGHGPAGHGVPARRAGRPSRTGWTTTGAATARSR